MSEQAIEGQGDGAHFTVPPFVGRAAVVERYGAVEVDHGSIVGPHGWESRWMTTTALRGCPRPMYLNRDIVIPAAMLFAEWERIGGYVIKHVGFFSPRAKRGYPESLSLHTYGIAFDLNPDDNPMQAKGEPVKTDIPAAWIASAKAMGWTWGGDFSRPDAMHLQWARGV